MPLKPKKIKRPWKNNERVAFGRRAKNNYEFYNSQRWRRVASLHKEKNPYCKKCLDEGRKTSVEFTDHIVRIEDGGEPYDENNLQSLCTHHHNQKSGKEAHGYKEGMGSKHQRK